MANVQEKLAQLRMDLEPEIRQHLAGGQMGKAASVLMSFLEPQVEGWLDRNLARPADELDAILAGLIDTLGRLRSDGLAALIVCPDGARIAGTTKSFDYGEAGVVDWFAAGDQIRAPAVRDGDHPVREVDADAVDLPVGGGAPAGGRPG
jgi:hypothetical protein